MTSKIRILDEKTINQIAAGEVVEDASSVIKELIENSLDAMASEIEIETRQGGRQYIKISDNGYGMGEDDALLSLERHATSKIKETKDLNTLKTMGFRGEALAAIASISKLTILTKTESKNDDATFIEVQAGKIIKVSKASRKIGTTIEVKSLFFNVPVRKRFQNSLSQDLAEIHKLLISLSFCYPLLKITWINDQKKVLEFYPKGSDLFYNLEERIKTACGNEFAKDLLRIDVSENDCVIQGFIGKPQQHRPNRSGQYLSLNRRLIQNHMLSKAVSEGYGTRLPERRFPLFVLQLKVSAEWVDANVHPQKKLVRLLEESFLNSFLRKSVDSTLQKAISKSFESHLNSFSNDFSVPVSNLPEQNFCLAETLSEYPLAKQIIEQNIQMDLPIKKEPMLIGVWQNFIFVEGSSIDPTYTSKIALFEQRSLEGTLFYQKIIASQDRIPSQTLLLPELIELNKGQFELIASHADLYEKIGFHINHLSGNSVLVDAIPQIFDITSLKDFIICSLEEIKSLHLKNLDQIKKSWALYVTRFIKRRSLSNEMALVLIKEAFSNNILENSNGKPLFQWISQEELQKRF